MSKAAFLLVVASSIVAIACGPTSSGDGGAAGGAGASGASGASTGGSGGAGAAGGGAGASDGGAGASATGGAGGAVLVPIPTGVDCSKPANCYHLACWDDPACAATPDPGGCAVGHVKDIGNGACRACTADDCDGLAGFCCGADVCKTNVACFQYICKDIEASCAGVTSVTCGFHDLDGDDAFGDCDEAPADPCCYCKIAVGCSDSPCTPGQLVRSGACAACGPNDCAHPSCKGLNGCATGCNAGFYFDGIQCRDCTASSSSDFIPACGTGAAGAGGASGAAGAAGKAGAGG